MTDFPRSLIEFQQRFPDEAACVEYLFAARWPAGFAFNDGRPIGIGFQEQVSNQSELLRSKAVVVNVGSKVPGWTWGRWVSGSRAEANPRRRVDNHTCRQNQRRSTSLGSVRREPDDRAGGGRRIEGGSRTQAVARNCGSQLLDAKGEAQAAHTARREYRSQELSRIGQ